MAETPTPSFPADSPLLRNAGALLANPYPLYAMLRANNPVFRLPIPAETGAGVWLLTRHSDVERALRDAIFSVDRREADVFKLYSDQLPRAIVEGPGGTDTMLTRDPPEHTRLRGLVSKAFTPRRVAELGPRIESLVAELLDEMSGGHEVDLIHDLAEPLPAIVIAELLGVPPEDHRRFRAWSSRLIERGTLGPRGAAEADGALGAIVDYIQGQIATRRDDPGDDLLSGLIAAQEERDALSESELVANVLLLLVAGHETTTNLIGNGTLALARNPEQWQLVRDDPGRIDGAVEELLRYDSPVQATVRVVSQPVELGGQNLEAGALVICGIGAANRDPEVHPEPDRLDVLRDPIRHLSFGFGTHFCLGASLARLEGRSVFRALAERSERIEVVSEELDYRRNPILRGVRSLPVRLH